MLVAIHQPEYLPWLGYFEKMLRADVFVLLDNVQFSKGDFHNRTRIKGAAGAQWLSVPVHAGSSATIGGVEVAGHSWEAKHWRSLVSSYSRAAFFREWAAEFEAFYRQSFARLIDYNVGALELLARAFGLRQNWVMASRLKAGGRKSELVLNICRELGADTYYSGRSGSTYLSWEEFERAGIEIKVQEFRHPVYEQLFTDGNGFTPNLSAIDLLFNCGPAGRELIRAAGAQAMTERTS
ncbi:MAG: WbqC family protein [Acidobacteria bacterium]|nr:WbqC family protein [Acidobacteriota bacterium]